MQMPDQAAPHVASPVAYGFSSILQQLQGDSQGINWCETDYAVSPVIAEWWNTMSNFAFLVMRPASPDLRIAANTNRSIRR